MKYAVIKAGGKQYKVSEGDELLLPRLKTDPKKRISFSEVLLLVDDKKRRVGTPTIRGASVTAVVIDHSKGKKIRVATYRAKSRYRKVKGYRDYLTRVKIGRIVTREKKAPTKSKSKGK